MRKSSSILFLSLSLATTAALLTFPARTFSAPEVAAPATQLEINNRNGLVTVQDKSGTSLFSQRIASPTLQITLIKPVHSRVTQIILMDGPQKKIWETTMAGSNLPKPTVHMEYTRDNSNAVVGQGINLSSKASDSPEAEQTAQNGSIVLEKDGFPGSIVVGFADSKIVMKRSDFTFVFTAYEKEKATGTYTWTAYEKPLFRSSGVRAAATIQGSGTSVPGTKQN